jgi:hypothetical protein
MAQGAAETVPPVETTIWFGPESPSPIKTRVSPCPFKAALSRTVTLAPGWNIRTPTSVRLSAVPSPSIVSHVERRNEAVGQSDVLANA